MSLVRGFFMATTDTKSPTRQNSEDPTSRWALVSCHSWFLDICVRDNIMFVVLMFIYRHHGRQCFHTAAHWGHRTRVHF